ncbi:two-component system response regulator [Streptomyces sp. NPDC059063]|uniref:response regulator n=1 Tax=unclassified Streptomyces TaxID=2593676 RepID=UPI00368A1E66
MPSSSKILVVDDHEDYLFALESALAPLGYETTRATNGDDALKEILRGHIAVALLDMRMPGVSGLDVVRYVRRVEQTQQLPVILLTGFDVSHELSSAALLLGVADIVVKPIDPWILRTKVRYLYETYERMCALQRELAEYRARARAESRVPTQPNARGRHRPVTKD